MGATLKEKHRLGEALGALMVLWVPRPSALSEKGPRHAVWGQFLKRHCEMWFCLHAGVQSCHWRQEMGKPRTRGTDMGAGLMDKSSQLSECGYSQIGGQRRGAEVT